MPPSNNPSRQLAANDSTDSDERRRIVAWMRNRPFRGQGRGFRSNLKLAWLMLRSPAKAMNGIARELSTRIETGRHWDRID